MPFEKTVVIEHCAVEQYHNEVSLIGRDRGGHAEIGIGGSGLVLGLVGWRVPQIPLMVPLEDLEVTVTITVREKRASAIDTTGSGAGLADELEEESR